MNRLESIRLMKGITQNELARISSVPQCTISKAEKGIKDLKGFEWLSIAKALGCTVDELLGAGK